MGWSPYEVDYFPKYEMSTKVGIKNYRDLMYKKYQEQQGAYLTQEQMFQVLDGESNQPLFRNPNGCNLSLKNVPF